VHGILVQLPLPVGLDPDPVLALVPIDKDVDRLTDRSMGRLVRNEAGLIPCTPLGVMRPLERYGVATSVRRAVVVGRSTLVGLPVALLLARKGSTPR
jgi:methylenetetrahydrofolate dehydrogenase (NADP+)/methenyltetrahydrofolate cyclohydrolase